LPVLILNFFPFLNGVKLYSPGPGELFYYPTNFLFIFENLADKLDFIIFGLYSNGLGY